MTPQRKFVLVSDYKIVEQLPYGKSMCHITSSMKNILKYAAEQRILRPVTEFSIFELVPPRKEDV